MNTPLDPELAERLEMLNTPALPDEVVVEISEDQLTDEPLSDEELLNPDVQSALVAEIQAAALRAVEIKQIINDAKTDAKRNHFRKKLTRNNEEAADMLVALQRITQVRETREEIGKESSNAQGHTISTGSRKEPTN